jgi:osmoprotectant transport system permease protein
VRVVLGGLGVALLVAAALVPGWSRPQARYLVGAKTFTEQYVLAALIEQRLREAGLTATTREGLGSSVIFNALRAGEIDAYVDYSGTIWTTQMRRTDVKPRADVITEMAAWLEREHKIKLLGGLGFENAYALAMPRKRAETLGVRSIADLARVARELAIAGDYEFFSRPEWRAIRDAYGLSFRAERTMQPEFMYQAAAAGEVDVISAYTSEGRVAQYDLVILDDPKHALPPYDAVILLAPRDGADRALGEALRPLVDAIDVRLMRDANLRATRGDGDASAEAVARWMWEEIKTRKP